MAYKGVRIEKTNMDSAYYLAAVCTAIEAMGWVLHDNVSSQVKVYKSNGEGGTKEYGYVKLDASNASLFYATAYVYWDSSAHVGYSSVMSGGSYNYLFFPGSYAGVYGDKDFVFLFNSDNGSRLQGFGHVPSPVNNTPIAALTAAATVGSDKTLAVTGSEGFSASTNYMLVDFATGNRDTVLVSSIVDATHVKVYSLPRNYAAGTKLGICPVRFGILSTSVGFAITAVPGLSAGVAETTTGENFSFSGFSSGNTDSASGRNIMTPFMVRNGGCFLGFSGDLDVCKIATAITPSTVWGVCNGWSPEQGQATSSTPTTLVDGVKSWSVDQWVDKYIVIIEGTGSWQVRKITANGPTAVTVALAWTTPPDGTSIYRIVDQAWRALRDGYTMALELEHSA